MKQALKLTLVMVLGIFLTFCTKSTTPEGGSIDAGDGNTVPDNSDFAVYIKDRTKTTDPAANIGLDIQANTGITFDPISTTLEATDAKWESGITIELIKQADIKYFAHTYTFPNASAATENNRSYFDQDGKSVVTADKVGKVGTTFITGGKPQAAFIGNFDNITKLFEVILYTDANGKKFYILGPPIYINHI